MMRELISVAVIGAASISPALADTAYLLPSTFTASKGQTITVEASFNDDCCVPKYAVRSDRFAIVGPDGSFAPPERIETFATSTIIEQAITQAGTTRFTTGERLGRKGEYVLLNGTYHLVNSEDAEPIDVPEGTQILSSQTATVSDVYVTVGDPTWDSLKVSVGRLTIVPSQHPSALGQGDRLDLTILFDAKPLAGQAVTLTRDGQRARPGDDGAVYTTDADGRVSVPLAEMGTHLIMTRKQAPAPTGADTDIRSYTTALTFDVR
jgi:hypothetical protein